LAVANDKKSLIPCWRKEIVVSSNQIEKSIDGAKQILGFGVKILSEFFK